MPKTETIQNNESLGIVRNLFEVYPQHISVEPKKNHENLSRQPVSTKIRALPHHKCKPHVISYEIWGYHSGEDVDVGLLGCDAVWTCRRIPSASSFNPEDGDSIFLLSVGTFLQVHTASQRRRTTSTHIIFPILNRRIRIWRNSLTKPLNTFVTRCDVHITCTPLLTGESSVLAHLTGRNGPRVIGYAYYEHETTDRADRATGGDWLTYWPTDRQTDSVLTDTLLNWLTYW